mmetsp:Transcript_26268/g.81824  ORF Transcript_26268/g.81824 Transcript_26268/m.81824 type:complete len:395 (-) Transcript_26268:89-1273(-)
MAAYLDVEGDPDDDLFDICSRFMRRTKLRNSNERLMVYGLFKQATEGDVTASRPGLLDMVGRAKWDAWKQLEGQTKLQARTGYIKYVMEHHGPAFQDFMVMADGDGLAEEEDLEGDEEGGGGGGDEAEIYAKLSTLSQPWQEGLRRTGVIGIKAGMLPYFDEWGQRHAATAVCFEACEVVQAKTMETDGYVALQVGGGGNRKVKNVPGTQLGHYKKQGVLPKYTLNEFRVSEAALLPPGTPLTAQHFVPGQRVDVQGVSKGKGFQGAMKRWGFKGMGASHGASKSHRSLGSIGQTGPGRVWKGKKMAGRMGGKTRTIDNLVVLRVDPEKNVVLLKGAIPGPKGSFVHVTDARFEPRFPRDPPFPTFFAEPGKDYEAEDAPPGERDPLSFEERFH